MTTLLEHFEAKFMPEPNSGCWLWVARLNEWGYGEFDSRVLGIKRAHRASWALYRGPIPEGLHVLHKCDVRCCVNPDHLFLGTNDDNVADCLAKGRYRYVPRPGELAGNARFRDCEIPAVRADPRPHKLIAAQYGCSVVTIRRIKKGTVYGHVGRDREAGGV